MQTGAPSSTDSYREYRETIVSDMLISSVRRGILIFSLINVLLIPLDYFLYPELFAVFLCLRASVTTAHAFIYLRSIETHPIASAAAAMWGVGVLIVAATFMGGSMAEYTAIGAVLMFCGSPVIIPLTARGTGVVNGLTLSGYWLALWNQASSISSSDLAIFATFPTGGLIAGIAAAVALDRIRFADFVQRRELEAARDNLAQLDKAKSRFSSNIHHELRTPLTLILAPLDSMRSGDLGTLQPAVKRTLDMMHANAQRLYRMINNLLDLSKVESGSLEIHRIPLDLDALVRKLILGAQPLAERKGIELTVEGVDELPEICADPEALEKILVNLIGNALKFTERGDSVSVIGERIVDGVSIRIRDTGIGIPADKLDTVFDRFAQVDNSATRRHEGTGIGLSLAQELVELHGGRIWAESGGEGLGTTMVVTLPHGEVDAEGDHEVLRTDSGNALGVRSSIEAIEADLRLEDHERSPDGIPQVEQAAGAREHASRHAAGVANHRPMPDDAPEILVAEDNPDMRTLLASVIGQEFRFRLACNGRDALEMARERRPDLILSDVMMPEMSGLDLCRAVKEDPQLGDLPVVLVTSKAEHEMKIEGLEIGADDYVTKPFHPRELMARVRALVRVRGLQRQLADRNEALEHALQELKLAEAQLVQSEKLSAVGELAAEIAHEVNNPVNFALNASRALSAAVRDLGELSQKVNQLDTRDSATLAQQLRDLADFKDQIGIEDIAETFDELSEIIVDGLSRTHSLVGDLRDFAAPEKRQGQRVAADIGRGLESTLKLMKATLSSNNARVELKIEPMLPKIDCDTGALNQVFLNLVKNAAEAFEDEGGEIEVRAWKTETDLCVTVKDNGPGVPEELRERIFEPFFTTKETGRGTGLGLAISRKIVESHGGSLEMETRCGEGTQFTITLPLHPPPPEA